MGVLARGALEGRPAYAQPPCSLTAGASLNGICHRQSPPPTALATSSNRLSSCLWGRVRGPFPSDASLALACIEIRKRRTMRLNEGLGEHIRSRRTVQYRKGPMALHVMSACFGVEPP